MFKQNMLKILSLLMMSIILLLSVFILSSCEEKSGVEVDGVTVTKTTSYDTVRTVHPGEEITYTYKFQNGTDDKKELEITDTLPSNTTFLSGDFVLNCDTLSLNVTVPADMTVYKSYTVTATENKGEAIVSNAAKINGQNLTSKTLYTAYTFNENDRVKFVNSLKALKDSEFEGAELIKHIYRVCVSVVLSTNDKPEIVLKQIFGYDTADEVPSIEYKDMVVPGLYGGNAVKEDFKDSFGAEQETEISEKDITVGDILCVLPSVEEGEGKFYVTDGKQFFDITEKCEKVTDTGFIDELDENDLFAVLRPSMIIDSDEYFRSDELYEGETTFEKAIISTANAFLMRGARMQYADTRLVNEPAVYRWERGKTPEDYTSDETGYSNCTGFVHDVYLNALGWDYGSFQLADAPQEMKAYTYKFTWDETDEEKAAIEKEYRSQLKVGDIVFYTRSGNTHAMLYVGNGNMIHCSGNTYSGEKESEEAGVRYMQLDSLFDPLCSSRYVFQTEKPRNALYIIRPSNMWEGEFPQSTLDRIEKMDGVFAEKTCSSTLGQTVNQGDELEYTFTVENRSSVEKTVTITDSVPLNTSLIEGGKITNKRELEWKITLKPDEEKKISYKVKVSKEAENGSAILCSEKSKVGGLVTKAPAVFVGKTLTADEQKKVQKVVEKNIDLYSTGFELVNEIYKDVLGIDNILGADVESFNSGILLQNNSNYTIASQGKYAQIIAPAQYGGKLVLNSQRFLGERTRLTREKNLIVGDVIYIGGKYSYPEFYIYIGDGKLLDSATHSVEDFKVRIESTIGRGAFAILRPSLVS